MKEIKINTDNLSEEIEKLKNLHTKIVSSHIVRPTVVGGGNTVTELEDIGELYEKIHMDVRRLVASTTAFMQNVNNSYKSSDNKSVKGFR